MWVTEQIKKYLDSSINRSCAESIYLTDLDSVVYVVSRENINKQNSIKPISKELLKVLLQFSKNVSDDNITLLNNDNTISIFDDIALNSIYQFQMILPIIIDDNIYGSLIFGGNINIHNKHMEFAEITRDFIQKMILQYLNQKHLLRDINKVNTLPLFSQDNLEYIDILLQNESELLNNDETVKQLKDKICNQESKLEEILSKEDYEKVEELLYSYSQHNSCECYLSYLIGLKTGMKITQILN